MNIAMVTASTSHGAATNTQAALEDRNHTVTVVDEDDLSTHDFSGYDAAVVARVSPDEEIADAVRDNLLAAGLPTVLGPSIAGVFAGTERTLLPTWWGVCGTFEVVSTADDGEEVVDNTHPVTDGFSLGNVTTHDGENFWAAVEDNTTVEGQILNHGQPGSDLAGQATTWVLESGATVDTVTLSAPLVVAGFVYGGQGEYTEDGKDMLDAAISYVGASGPFLRTGAGGFLRTASGILRPA